jgi:hypothetical protein
MAYRFGTEFIFDLMWSASLIAMAVIVKVGFAEPEVGKTELPPI